MGLYKRLMVCLWAYLVCCCLTGSALAAHRNDIVGDSLGSRAVTFANLVVACPAGGGTPGSCAPQVNGTNIYCSDCAQTTPCSGSGTGAWATFLNSGWQCGLTPSPALVTPVCATPPGTSNYTIAPTGAAFPITECVYLVLGANIALAYTVPFVPTGRAGWTFKAYVRQPAVGGPFSLSLAGTSPGFTLTSGCPSLPAMPTGAGHGLDLVFVLDGATAKLNLEACNTTGN